jgi:serine/threonine protein kinase
MENQFILSMLHQTMQDLEVHAYHTKRAKLALSLIMTMARVHKSKILHNDISPSNILLHFLLDHVDRVYIGVCDWGMATCIIEVVHLVYGYPTKDEIQRNKKECFWVALELFYVYGPPNLRHHWSMYIGDICIQRKRMHTRLGRWHNVFGMRNGTCTYLSKEFI